jgi:DNA ligase (NAD+)
MKKKKISNDFFNGKNVICTGTFGGFSREELEEFIISNGGLIVSTVSKKTNIIIVGDNPGPSKLEKVYKLSSEGIKIEIAKEIDLVHTSLFM